MTKKIAFLFLGQGSQTVGMLNSCQETADTANIYSRLMAQANSCLNQNLEQLIAQGPLDSLNLTVNTQPAMLLADVMLFEIWKHFGGPQPDMVAGHSLGEYAALVAAKVLTLEHALPLVRLRATAMQEAVPVGQGGMAAILGLTDEQVLQACTQASQNNQVVEAVNFNAPSQVVIAGHAQAVGRACVLAKEMGAKRALELPVSAPFHSSLMKPAANALSQALSCVPLQTPICPVINNVDVAQEFEPARIADALVRQAFNPVRWVETIQAMQAQGATLFVECGPGKVLSGLVKRISDVPVISINDPASAQAALATLNA